MRDAKIKETEFLGLHFAEVGEEDVLEWVMDRSRDSDFSYVVTPNVDHIVQLYGDQAGLGRPYMDAHLRLCDSRIVGLMARLSGTDLSFVTGSGLTSRMFSRPLPPGLRIAIVGSNAHQRAWLGRTQPDTEFLYCEPPMGLRNNAAARAEVAAFVEAAQADITLITVGAPQSEMIANLIHARGMARGVGLCVGASLAFVTGEKPRAPTWVQAMCMEWAFRLLCEPRRLARRYLIDGPRIFSIWMRWAKAPRLAFAPAVSLPETSSVWERSPECISPAALEWPVDDVADVNEGRRKSEPVVTEVTQPLLPGC